jgi:hypothetical protein
VNQVVQGSPEALGPKWLLCSYIKNRRLNKQVNKDKQYIKHKDVYKDSFYLIFFTQH